MINNWNFFTIRILRLIKGLVYTLVATLIEKVLENFLD